MPGCIVSATTASFCSVEKRRLRATPLITSTFENVSDIGTCLGLSLGPPAIAGVRSKRGAVHSVEPGSGLLWARGRNAPIFGRSQSRHHMAQFAAVGEDDACLVNHN